MSEELLVKQCSPTLAGLKTGNLFSCPAEEYGALCCKIRQMNVRLVPRRRKTLNTGFIRSKFLADADLLLEQNT